MEEYRITREERNIYANNMNKLRLASNSAHFDFLPTLVKSTVAATGLQWKFLKIVVTQVITVKEISFCNLFFGKKESNFVLHLNWSFFDIFDWTAKPEVNFVP